MQSLRTEKTLNVEPNLMSLHDDQTMEKEKVKKQSFLFE